MINLKRTDPASDVIGIDIGPHAIKLIVLEHRGGKALVRDAITIPAEDGWIADGVIQDPKTAGRMIRAMLKMRGVKATRSSFSVPTEWSETQVLELPRAAWFERRSAARLKLRKRVTMPLEAAYLDVAQVAPVLESGNIPVHAVVASKPVVDSRAETLLYAGLDPIGAELDVHALLRTLERQIGEESELARNMSITIIDLGTSSTQVYVLQTGGLQFMRSVKVGTYRIASEIGERNGMTFDSAFALLHDPATFLDSNGDLVYQPNGRPPHRLLSGAFDSLVREFTRLLRYFRSLNPERGYVGILDRAIFCGGIVHMRGLRELLGERLGLQVAVATPFSGIPTDVDAAGFKELQGQEASFLVSLGLALGCRANANENKPGGGVREYEFEWQRSA